MPVYVYQSFEIKQDKFKEGIENLQEIKKYRNENFTHNVDILTPITGKDHTYALLSTYDGLAEMEWQNKKMFDDEEYLKLIEEFFWRRLYRVAWIHNYIGQWQKRKKIKNQKRSKRTLLLFKVKILTGIFYSKQILIRAFLYIIQFTKPSF
jgi:hypothetical protein